MPDITKGKTFSSGDTVTAADLNSLLDDAVINNNAITANHIADSSINNSAVSGTAAIDFSKLASLSTGQVLAGNEGTPTATTLSADVTLAADGAVTIANDAVTQAKIADDAVGADQIADGAVDGAAIAMGSDAQGDILYYDGTSYVRLGAGTAGQVLQSGGAGANPSWVDQAEGNPSVGQIDFFTSGTSQTFTVPSGITRIKVTAAGGGGGGNNSNDNGESGGYFEKAITVTGGSSVTYTVGGGGAGQDASSGSSGGSTTVTYDGTTYTAGGGSGGGSGSGGTATNGDINIAGGGSTIYRGYGGGGSGGDESSGSNGQGGFVKIEY